jgi:hypothetical protein
MAKQKGIIKLEGTIGDITFYKTKDGLLARQKGGIDADRMKTDPAFARTRENGEEFGRAGSAGKLLRTAFRTLVKSASDSKLVSRLTGEMMAVVKADSTSTRGKRNVLDGELELLKGFDFNINGKLGTTVFAQYVASLDRTTGVANVTFPVFAPKDDVAIPQGATHMKLISGAAQINFETGAFTTVKSESAEIDLLLAKTDAEIVLKNTLAADGTDPLFLLLGIEFFQKVNGASYSLKNGAFNSLAIVAVQGL